MQIEFIEQVGWREQLARTYMLLSTKPMLPTPQHKRKIAMYALDKAPESLAVLAAQGIKCDLLCNSDPDWAGKKFLGYTLANTWDIIEQKEDYHFIVPSTSPYTRSAIVCQMRLHGITSYSILKELQLPNFEWMRSGDRLKDVFRQSWNELMDLCITDDCWVLATEAPAWFYVRGLSWWDKIYEWFDDDAAITGAASMLEIGPGIGLFSRLAKKMIKGIKVDWLGLDQTLPEYSNGLADNVFVANIETDDIPAGEYDIIVMTEVIEHFRGVFTDR